VTIRTGRDGDPAHAREFAMFVSRTLHAAADQVEPRADGLERIRAKIRPAPAHAWATRPGFLAGRPRPWAAIRDRWYQIAAEATLLRCRAGHKRPAYRRGRAGDRDLHEVLHRPVVAIACAVFAAGVVLAVPPLRQALVQLSSSASSVLFNSKSGGGITTGGGKPTGSSKPQCSEPSEQCEYQNIILQDRSALSLGFILIQDPIRIHLGQSYNIRVAVCGKSVVMCNEYVLGTTRTEPEPSRFQDKLLIGARIQASLEGMFPGSVQNMTPLVQPIIASTDAATWIWQIQPSRGGNFNLILTLTPLEGNTNIPLVQDTPIQINITISMTPWQEITSALSYVRDFLLSLGGVLSELGVTAVAFIVWAFRRVNRTRTKKSAPVTPTEIDKKQPEDNAHTPSLSNMQSNIETAKTDPTPPLPWSA
jgi:hypothetical protein